MWKYYEKERNYSAAARILAKLADRDTEKFTLWDRVDYISRAILCAKACSTTLNNDVSLTTLISVPKCGDPLIADLPPTLLFRESFYTN